MQHLTCCSMHVSSTKMRAEGMHTASAVLPGRYTYATDCGAVQYWLRSSPCANMPTWLHAGDEFIYNQITGTQTQRASEFMHTCSSQDLLADCCFVHVYIAALVHERELHVKPLFTLCLHMTYKNGTLELNEACLWHSA